MCTNWGREEGTLVQTFTWNQWVQNISKRVLWLSITDLGEPERITAERSGREELEAGLARIANETADRESG